EQITRDQDGADEGTPSPRLPEQIAGDLTDIPSVGSVAQRRHNRITVLLEEIAGDGIAISGRQQEPEEGLGPTRRPRGRTTRGHPMLLTLTRGHWRPLQMLSTAARASFSARTPAGSRR